MKADAATVTLSQQPRGGEKPASELRGSLQSLGLKCVEKYIFSSCEKLTDYIDMEIFFSLATKGKHPPLSYRY